MDPILDPLNEKQREAVKHGAGPLLIFAGAGSGKTRTITHRIAYLIREHNVPPHEIMGVTFTNKAAGEMQERTRELVGEGNIQPELRTFHSFGVRVLREEVSVLDRKRNFSIYDDQDQLSILKECLEDLNLDPKQLKPRSLASRINRAKDQMLGVDNYAENQEGEVDEQFLDIYRQYQEKLSSNNAYDFGDLLVKPVKLFQNNETVRERWQNRFSHLLVDEFQDTNPAQFELAKILSEQHRNIVVVGDDDQSIYSWRGADVSNILNFEQHFPEATTIRLERNYRSTQPILDVAHAVISKNSQRQEKQLWTDKEQGREPEVYTATNDYEEAEYVLETIQLLEKMQDIPPGECAIFFRVNAQTRVFEEVFMREDMPYKLVSSVGFYERKEIKDLLAFLKLIVNPEDAHSLQRIINTPSRGIGPKTEQTLMEHAGENSVSGLEALEELLGSGKLSTRAENSLRGFYELYNKLVEVKDAPPLEVIETVLETTEYIQKVVEKEDKHTAESRMENIQELKRVAADFAEEQAEPTLENFVEEITLLTDVDTYEADESAVNLMTLHAAKGLEFTTVFMAGMEEGLLPHSNAEFDPERKEEERRLCYVGFTRAKERLYCTWSRRRRLYGTERQNHPSPFLKEAGLLEEATEPSSTRRTKKQTGSRGQKKQPTVAGSSGRSDKQSETEVGVQAGDRVKHPKFGPGEVVEVTGKNSSPVAEINFESAGSKRLALEFAKLEQLS